MSSQVIGSFLLLHIWQVTLVLLIIWGATRVTGKRWPHLTLLLWVVFLVKCVTPPLIESPVGILEWATPTVSFDTFSGGESEMFTPNATYVDETLLRELTLDSQPSSVGSAWSKFNGLHWSHWVVGSWALGMFVIGVAMGRRYFQVVSVVKNEANDPPVDDRIRRQFHRQLEKLGWRPDAVQLVISKAFKQPFVFGFFRPVIVLPEHFVSQPKIVEAVVGHELCHLWRRDPLLGWLQLLSQVILWFHPGIWYANRAVSHWCELCCDDDTMRIFAIPSTTYASGLVSALEQQSVASPSPVFPGFGQCFVTRERIESILTRPHSGIIRSTYLVSAVVLVLLVTPTKQSEDWRWGLDAATATQSESESLAGLTAGPEEMNFLVGKWEIFGLDRAGQPKFAGQSEFVVALSGRMIGENWVGQDGSTAQGITFFDPATKQWKMTWVDSNGVVSESSGDWSEDTLTLVGQRVTPDGEPYNCQTELKQRTDDEFRLKQFVQIEGQTRLVSTTVYQRRK
ncbi:MAG: M56 family metallopeptidase [Planctomycetota bacterium]